MAVVTSGWLHKRLTSAGQRKPPPGFQLLRLPADLAQKVGCLVRPPQVPWRLVAGVCTQAFGAAILGLRVRTGDADPSFLHNEQPFAVLLSFFKGLLGFHFRRHMESRP